MKVTPEEAAVLRRLMDHPAGVDARRLGNAAPRVAALRDRGLVRGELSPVITDLGDRGLVRGELSPVITDLGVRVWVAHVCREAGVDVPDGLLPRS